MTKKDYDVIAACIGAAQSNRKNDKLTIDDLSDRLILEFQLDNARFNEAIFWQRVEYWRQLSMGE